jgi:ribonuclease HIII
LRVQFLEDASKLVEKAAEEFTRRYDKDKLDEIAKVHFKVTKIKMLTKC